MRSAIIILIFLAGMLRAQNYEKDWSSLNKRLENNQTVALNEWEAFAAKYKAQHEKYADNSTQLFSLLGHEYSKLQQPEEAEENYLRSLGYARQAQDTSLKYIVAYSLGVLNYNNNHLLQAQKYYLSCLAGMAAIYGQSSREYTAIFTEYTRLLIDLGKYSDAKPYVEALLYYYKTLDGENNVTYISLLNSKAIIAQNEGDYESAIAVFSSLAESASLLQLGDTLAQVIQLSNLGDAYREAGYFDLAIATLKKAKQQYYAYRLDRNPKAGDRSVPATFENNLALCYKAISDPRMAEEAYNNALAIYKAIGETNTEPYCTTLSNKANLLSDLGRGPEASEILLTVLEMRRTYFGSATENYANALANLANVYFDAGYYKEALEKNLEASEVYKATVGEQHQNFANNMNSLSLCYLQMKEYKKAEEYKIRALAITESAVGKNHYRYMAFLVSTSGLYYETNQPDKAERSLREAMMLVERNFGKAHELYARAEFALAEVYSTQGKYEAAATLYFECLDYYSAQLNDYFNAMSEENQGRFLQSLMPVFESYNNFLIHYRLSQPSAALSQHLARALKCQLQLKSLLANRSAQVRKEIAGSNDETLKRLYRDWLLVKNELINRFKSAEPLENNNDLFKTASELESQLKARLKNFTVQHTVTFETLKEKLGAAEAAIELFKVSDMEKDKISIRYGALLVRKNSAEPAFVIFKDGNALDSLCFNAYSLCIDEQLPDTVSYTSYFKPFEKHLKGITRIYISADGIFNKIGVAGLYNPAGKKYLADDYSIVQTSNLGSIASAPTHTAASGLRAELFGYPDYDYDLKTQSSKPLVAVEQQVAKRFGLTKLAKLPGTKIEVEGIAKTLKKENWDAQVYTEQFASEKNLRQVKSPRVLHIATHGFYLKDVESEDKLFLGFERSAIKYNPLLRSGIILAGVGPATEDSTNLDSENDGILTASEAALLNLSNTDLVVLSACQTGLGDEMGTEGVAGLQRSFAIAGAKNIIMSLWPVDDNATQLLMTEFYKRYALSRDVEAAFKGARQAVRSTYSHPYFWAAFVLLKTFN